MWPAHARVTVRLVACHVWRTVRCRGKSQRGLSPPCVLTAAVCGILWICVLVLVFLLFSLEPSQAVAVSPLKLRGRAGVEIDVVFVTDCSDYQEWLTQVFLLQWRRSGPHGARLTRVVACDEGDPKRERALAYSAAAVGELDIEVFNLPELNGKGHDRYLCNNRPRGLRRWLKERPPLSTNHWIVLLDPDMLALKQVDESVYFRLAGGAAEATGDSKWRLVDVPSGVALAHHFEFVPRDWRSLNLSLSALCANTDAILPECEERLRPLFDDQDLVAREYSVGVPHLIRANDLARMGQAWELFTDRVREQYRGWTAEMFSWILAARYAGVRFAYLAEVVTDPNAAESAWEAVDSAAEAGHGFGDGACAGILASTLSPRTPESEDGPWLLHFCEVYNVSYMSAGGEGGRESFYLDKRAVKKSLKAFAREAHFDTNMSMLDCNAPLFKAPPRDLLSRLSAAVGASGSIAARRLFRRSAWLLCTVVQAANAGLRDLRTRRHCPHAGEDKETLRAWPAAAELSDVLSRAAGPLDMSQRRKQVDWAAKLNATLARQRRRADTTEGRHRHE